MTAIWYMILSTRQAHIINLEKTREDEEGSSSEQKFCNALFHLGRKLFQLYIVDSYIRAENSDLRFLRSHTKQLKVDKYLNLKKYLETKAAKEDNCVPGKIYVIPSSHTVWQKEKSLKKLSFSFFF